MRDDHQRCSADIVERLLSRPDDINPALKQEAADEIKRLRFVVKTLRFEAETGWGSVTEPQGARK